MRCVLNFLKQWEQGRAQESGKNEISVQPAMWEKPEGLGKFSLVKSWEEQETISRCRKEGRDQLISLIYMPWRISNRVWITSVTIICKTYSVTKTKRRKCCQGMGPKCKGLDLFSSSAVDFNYVFSSFITEGGSRRINELVLMCASLNRSRDWV